MKVEDEERGVEEEVEGDSALKGLVTCIRVWLDTGPSVYKLAIWKQCTGGMKQGTETVCCQRETEVVVGDDTSVVMRRGSRSPTYGKRSPLPLTFYQLL